MKEYFYYVNGIQYHDNDCFGKAWHEAKAEAERTNAKITRLVVDGEKQRNEIYKLGCFVSEF